MFAVIIFVHTVGAGTIDVVKVNPKYPSYDTCEAARPDAEDSYRRFLVLRFAPKFTIESKCVAEKSGNEDA